jgi:hypothetical protein
MLSTYREIDPWPFPSPRPRLSPRQPPCTPWPECVQIPPPFFPGFEPPLPVPALPVPPLPPLPAGGRGDWTGLLVILAAVALILLGLSALRRRR